MSLIAMPLVVTNLGSEMLFILDQRLKAQCIAEEKATKVLDDVVLAWFDNGFIEELFKPQPAYSLPSTRTIFDRLAHSSIMRLSPSSMDKLYDLMVMGFKYQFSCCQRSQDLLQVTLTHLMQVAALVRSPAAREAVQMVHARVLSLYETLTWGQWGLLRQEVARFLQDKRVKVSLFLQEGIQATDGSVFLPAPLSDGYSWPVGMVRYHKPGDAVREETLALASTLGNPADFFCHPAQLGDDLYDRERPKVPPPPGRSRGVSGGMLGLRGPVSPADAAAAAAASAAAAARGDAASDPEAVAAPEGSSSAEAGPSTEVVQSAAEREAAAAALTEGDPQRQQQPRRQPGSSLAELSLLASLIRPRAEPASNFRLQLFGHEPVDGAATIESRPSVTAHVETVTFGSKDGGKGRLHDLMKDLDVTSSRREEDEGDDLLELMDSVA